MLAMCKEEMNLSNMTREQLWALDKEETMRLAYENGLRMDCTRDGASGCWGCTLDRLEKRRLELQQSAAEERQER